MSDNLLSTFLGPTFWTSVRGKTAHHQAELIDRATRDSLLTTELFELYLSSTQDLEGGWVMVIAKGAGRPPRTRTKDHHLDLKAIRKAHGEGASLLLARLQKRRPEVALVTRAVEEAFVRNGLVLSARVGANAYLTPPGSRGFHVHNDGHDVIVLQLEGEKRWSLGGFAPTLPLEGDTAVLEDAPEPLEVLTLRPGDALYVPRGVFHAAETVDTHSLHITLSIHVMTQRELIERALSGVEALRADVAPINTPLEETADEHEALLGQLVAALDPARLRRAAIAASKEAIADWEIIPDTHLRGAWQDSAGGNGLRFRRAAGVFSLISGGTNGSVEVVCPSETIRGPAVLREPLEYVLGADRTFSVADVPGPLTEEAKVELVQKLLDSGLVTLAVE